MAKTSIRSYFLEETLRCLMIYSKQILYYFSKSVFRLTLKQYAYLQFTLHHESLSIHGKVFKFNRIGMTTSLVRLRVFYVINIA